MKRPAKYSYVVTIKQHDSSAENGNEFGSQNEWGDELFKILDYRLLAAEIVSVREAGEAGTRKEGRQVKHETKAERLARALMAMGCIEIPSKTRKYRTFLRKYVTAAGKPTYYFVGKMGALRAGTCATKSVSLEQLIPALLESYAPLEVKK